MSEEATKPRPLSLVSVEGADQRVLLNVRDDGGGEHQLELSVFEASTLISGLGAAQREALDQESAHPPPVGFLPLLSFMIGQSGPNEVLRLYVAEGLYQDFAAEKGTLVGAALRRFSEIAGAKAG